MFCKSASVFTQKRSDCVLKTPKNLKFNPTLILLKTVAHILYLSTSFVMDNSIFRIPFVTQNSIINILI